MVDNLVKNIFYLACNSIQPHPIFYAQIPSLVDLPVGENLQSHAGTGGLYFSIREKSGFYIPQLLTAELIPSSLRYILKGDGIALFLLRIVGTFKNTKPFLIWKTHFVYVEWFWMGLSVSFFRKLVAVSGSAVEGTWIRGMMEVGGLRRKWIQTSKNAIFL